MRGFPEAGFFYAINTPYKIFKNYLGRPVVKLNYSRASLENLEPVQSETGLLYSLTCRLLLHVQLTVGKFPKAM
jgi:hypothetical protein